MLAGGGGGGGHERGGEGLDHADLERRGKADVFSELSVRTTRSEGYAARESHGKHATTSGRAVATPAGSNGGNGGEARRGGLDVMSEVSLRTTSSATGTQRSAISRLHRFQSRPVLIPSVTALGASTATFGTTVASPAATGLRSARRHLVNMDEQTVARRRTYVGRASGLGRGLGHGLRL